MRKREICMDLIYFYCFVVCSYYCADNSWVIVKDVSNRLLKDEQQKHSESHQSLTSTELLPTPSCFPTRDSDLFISKGLHLSAPSEVVQALFPQTHEYIKTGWCSVNAKDLPIYISSSITPYLDYLQSGL